MRARPGLPNMAVMGVPGLDSAEARLAAVDAVRITRSLMPRVTSASAADLRPVWGEEWFGVSWSHPHLWYQESGTRPFTMNSLAGKTIPMWVNDPDGSEAAKNPRAKTRVTDDGRRQVLIFRRAARRGQRKQRLRSVNGVLTSVSVPASYPGAPGRIAVNRSRGLIRQGDVNPGQGNPGWIAKGNVGVRWRHPGLNAGRFLARGVTMAALDRGLPVQGIRYLNTFSGQVGPLVTVTYNSEG